MRKILPRGEQVLISPQPATPRGGKVFGEPSRIIVPEVAEEPSRTGKVMACGPDVGDLEVGDMVLFPRYAGVEFVRGEDAEEFVGLRLMKESDIILKIERN